jgi:hypothetical protein
MSPANRKTRAQHSSRTSNWRPNANGICERANNLLNEFYRVTFRTRLDATLDPRNPRPALIIRSIPRRRSDNPFNPRPVPTIRVIRVSS